MDLERKRAPRSDIGKKHNWSSEGLEKVREIGSALGSSWKGVKRGPQSPEHIAKLSAIRKGRTSPMKGKTHSDETRAILSQKAKEQWDKISPEERSQMFSGENSPRWLEDRTKLKNTRNGIDPTALVHWRKQIFERDHYTCQNCKKIGGELNADHIKPLSLFPELALDLNNGRTLCYQCHSETPTFCGRVAQLTREDFA